VPLVYSCIAPHGSELIPALAGGKLRAFSPTRKGMRALAVGMEEADPDTVVVASPHSLRLLRHIGVVISENTTGRLAEGRREVGVSARCDVDFGRRLIDEAERRGLPVVGANYGALEGRLSNLAMDWGSLVPLWFFLKERRIKSSVVVVTPSRGIPLSQNFEFGRAVAKVAEGGRKRVSFVASSDQAHAHSRRGPYGFNAAAKKYDGLVVKAIQEGRLESVMAIDPGLVEAAKPDSLWQMAMLAGALSVVPMRGELVSYQVATYFGMVCAKYTRG
jgi:aromatic ring-opening dioxygenase LigB subunit